MKPRSPVSSRMRGSAAASSTSVRDEGLPHRSGSRRPRRAPAGTRSSDIGQVVPLDLALHVRDALAERRAGDEHVRRSGGGVEPGDGAASAARSWPSTSCTSQPKARQRAARAIEREHVRRVAEGLLAVQVDDRDQAARAGGAPRTSPPPTASPRCTRRRSRGRRSARTPLETRGERRPGAHRQSLTERARGEVDAAQRVLGVHAEEACRPRSSVSSSVGGSQPRSARAA